PFVASGIAVVLMRTEARPEVRPRLVLGGLLIGLPALGIWHLAAGAPTDAHERAHAAGFVGYVLGGPLADGLTAWLAVPILLLAMLFGLLLVTGTTVREVPHRLRELFGTAAGGDEYGYDEYGSQGYGADGYEGFEPAGYEAGTPARGRPRRRGRTPVENYPPDEFAGADPLTLFGDPEPGEPPLREPKQIAAAPAAEPAPKPRKRAAPKVADQTPPPPPEPEFVA